MQRNRNNNKVFTLNNTINTNNYDNSNNNNASPTNYESDQLFGVKNNMGLDGLLSSTTENTRMETNGCVGPSSESINVVRSCGSNGVGSIKTSSSSNFDHNVNRGIDWEWEIGNVDVVGPEFQLWGDKEEIISWLWENDDQSDEPVFSDLSVDLDVKKK